MKDFKKITITIPTNSFPIDEYNEFLDYADKFDRVYLNRNNNLKLEIINALIKDFADTRFIIYFFNKSLNININFVYHANIRLINTSYILSFISEEINEEILKNLKLKFDLQYKNY